VAGGPCRLVPNGYSALGPRSVRPCVWMWGGVIVGVVLAASCTCTGGGGGAVSLCCCRLGGAGRSGGFSLGSVGRLLPKRGIGAVAVVAGLRG